MKKWFHSHSGGTNKNNVVVYDKTARRPWQRLLLAGMAVSMLSLTACSEPADHLTCFSEKVTLEGYEACIFDNLPSEIKTSEFELILEGQDPITKEMLTQTQEYKYIAFRNDFGGWEIMRQNTNSGSKEVIKKTLTTKEMFAEMTHAEEYFYSVYGGDDFKDYIAKESKNKYKSHILSIISKLDQAHELFEKMDQSPVNLDDDNTENVAKTDTPTPK